LLTAQGVLQGGFSTFLRLQKLIKTDEVLFGIFGGKAGPYLGVPC